MHSACRKLRGFGIHHYDLAVPSCNTLLLSLWERFAAFEVVGESGFAKKVVVLVSLAMPRDPSLTLLVSSQLWPAYLNRPALSSFFSFFLLVWRLFGIGRPWIQGQIDPLPKPSVEASHLKSILSSLLFAVTAVQHIDLVSVYVFSQATKAKEDFARLKPTRVGWKIKRAYFLCACGPKPHRRQKAIPLISTSLICLLGGRFMYTQ